MALHCPATLLVSPSPADEGRVRAIVDQLSGERVLAVVTAPGDRLGGEVATVLDVPHEEDPALAGEAGREVLAGVADLHRGETVVVLTPARGDTGAGIVRVELGDAL